MFGIESKFYRATIIIYKVVLANLLFLLTSLLIITIPASISALLYTLSGNDVSVVRKYLTHFKKSLLTTIPLGVFNVFTFFTIISLITGLQNRTLLASLLIIISSSFLVMYNLGIYFFQNQTKEKNYFFIFRNSFFLTIISFPKLFIMLSATGIVLYVSEMFFSNSFLFFGLGAIFYVVQRIFSSSINIIQEAIVL